MPNGKGATGAGGQQPVRRGKTANQRADAQRNRAKILAATVIAIRKNPDASVADIAAEAGVGRMTLYLSLIHISEPTRRHHVSRMPSSA